VLAAGLATACSSTSSSSSAATATSTASVSSSTPTSQASTKPAANITVPPLIGTSESLAARQLAYDGLRRVKEVLAANLYFGADRVLATSPSGGDRARPGVTVIVYASLGPQDVLRGAVNCSTGCVNGVVTQTMPDVCGLTFQQAATVLVARDITLLPPDGDVNPPGRITGSAPAARTVFVAYGSNAARPVTVTLATLGTYSSDEHGIA
jgi:beta-lactam-binding protein with PASTA domain